MYSDKLAEGWCVSRCPESVAPGRCSSRYCPDGNRSKTALRACSSSELEKVSCLRLVFLLSSEDPWPWDTRDPVAVEPSLCPSMFQDLAESRPLEQEAALEVEPCGHWIRSPCQCQLKSRPWPRAPWVSDLILRDAASGVVGALNSGSESESGLSMTPASTTVTSPSSVNVGKVSRASFTNRFSQSKQQRCNSLDPFRLFGGRVSHLGALALAQTVPHVCQHCLVPSRLRFFGCRHRSAVGGDDAPVDGCHPHGLYLVVGVLHDRVGINEIVLQQV